MPPPGYNRPTRTNESLSDSEVRFQSLFEQAPVSIQLLGPDGSTVQVNKSWEVLWQVHEGDGLKEFVLSAAYNVLTDTQLEEKGIAPYLRRAFAGESVKIPPIYYDTSELGEFGRARWVAAHAHPVKDKDGRVQEVMLMHDDITDRINAETTLRASEERFRSLVMATSQIIWIAAADGTIVEDSPSWRAFTGQTYDESMGYGWLDAIHPNDRENAARVWADSVAERRIFETEYRLRRADGGYRWTSARGVPVLNADGSIREWMGANTDIHEIKSTEALLAERLAAETRQSALLGKIANASRTLHTALSMSDIAQILVSEVRDILQVHQAVVSLTEGENWSQSIHAVSLSEKYANYRSYDAKTEGTGIYAEVCRTNRVIRLTQQELEQHFAWNGFGRHADKHPPMRGWLAVPLIDRNGENLGLIQASDKHEGDFNEADEAILVQLASIASNGFENARLYSSLQEQDRRKDEFLAMLAHELRNPLAPINAAADLLSVFSPDQPNVMKTSEIISRQVRHMTGLIDDLLDVSRVTRGLVRLDQTDLDVNRIVADAVEQARPLMEAKRHYLTVESAPGSIHVLGDQKRLVQVLINLLHNAAKYTPEGGNIRLKMGTSGANVLISVLDDGIGIAKNLQSHIFELFAQAERTSDRAQGGLGIGLALVKRLVELHGGKVSVTSEGVGHGCQFNVSLPLLAKRQDVEAGKRHNALVPSATAKKLRILVVDDNADAAEMLAMYLQTIGHDVVVEHSSTSALERAKHLKPDVCVLDIGLPEMDGNELARIMKAQPETARSLLIAVTGYGQEHDRLRTNASGFDHHFVKPVDMGKLVAVLAEVSRR